MTWPVGGRGRVALAAGMQLGNYEVLGLLGAGGMGEVYRCRDGRLGREVAIKVVRGDAPESSDHFVRFEREARLLAQVNHPNIAIIHGLEDADGVRFLVLELVPGDSLADRLRLGPVPVPTALALARQVAEALQAAHAKGIVHRDLKPANIKITPAGLVKVLDFGLAKTFIGGAISGDPHVQTISFSGTSEGMILGTPAYMSPEQARGKPVDERTDIWAFCCVLYEALTGRRAFSGETVTDTLVAVLERDPDWSILPAETPAALRDLLRGCLQKDAARRPQSAAELRQGVEAAEAGPPAPASYSVPSTVGLEVKPTADGTTEVPVAPLILLEPAARAAPRWAVWLVTGSVLVIGLWILTGGYLRPAPLVIAAFLLLIIGLWAARRSVKVVVWIIAGSVSVALVGGGVGIYFAFFHKKEEPPPTPPNPFALFGQGMDPFGMMNPMMDQMAKSMPQWMRAFEQAEQDLKAPMNDVAVIHLQPLAGSRSPVGEAIAVAVMKRLGADPSLRVVSHRGYDMKAGEAAACRELRTRQLLIISLTQEGNRLVLGADLKEASGAARWTERYPINPTVTPDDARVDEVARKIAADVKPKLGIP